MKSECTLEVQLTTAISFLTELRNIAVNIQLISSSTLGRMKKAPILLGSRRKLRSKTEKGPDPEELEEDDCLQYDLRRPGQVFIADDTNAYQLFGDSIFTAPQEDLLEGSVAHCSILVQHLLSVRVLQISMLS
jgi:hypothetical protein